MDPGICVSNLLHEAGHLAVLPSRFRPTASVNLDRVYEFMFKKLEDTPPESPEVIAALHSGETEATAWAWGVGKHLETPEHLIIQDNEYDVAGKIIRLSLSMNSYMGINGLQCGGYCSVKAGAYADYHKLPVYPKLKFWLQN